MQLGTSRRSAIGYALFLRRASVICAFISRTVHEGTTVLGAATATESPGVTGSHAVHVRCGSTRPHPVHAYWRFDDTHVRFAPSLPLPRPHHQILQVLIRGRATVRAPASQRHPRQNRTPEQPGAHGRERLSVVPLAPWV